ncbi:MAG TPA: VWA domain-containing protein, partial [Anaerolineae bacterium]|nr:VWA domain-containing protein [Anaerolineae bacterium]
MRRSSVRWHMRVFGLLLLAVGFLAGLPGWTSAQSGPPVLIINQVLTEEFPQVVSYVTVVDASGLPVAGLTEQAFTVTEDGNSVGQFVLSPANQEGVRIILAVDTSGSMLGGTALSDAQHAARTFLSQLGPKDQAALIVFAEQADLVQDFTSNLASLESSVAGLTALPNARTALYEAAFEAAERMVQVPAGRKAILILTDGTNTVGGFTLKDAIDKAQEANVPIYTVGLLGGEFDP